MSQLESFKDIWQNQGDSKIKFTKDDLYEMMHVKSTTTVKWILIISIAEFLIPVVFLIFGDVQKTKSLYNKYGLNNTDNIYTIVYLAVMLFFIYKFYKNYKNICIGNSVKSLLQDILNTRKIVKNYIYFNIGMAAIWGFHILYLVFNSEKFLNTLPENTNMMMLWIIVLTLFAIALFLFWLLYRLIFGFFLRKLNRNYKELQQNQ